MERLSGACDCAPLATCQALPCHDLGGASRGWTGSQGSPVRGARSAGRRPDLDGPSARATIAPGRGRGASNNGRRPTASVWESRPAAPGRPGRRGHRSRCSSPLTGPPPNSLRRMSAVTSRSWAAPRHPGALIRSSVEGRLCRDFVAEAAKMSEVVPRMPCKMSQDAVDLFGLVGHGARDGPDGRPIQDA